MQELVSYIVEYPASSLLVIVNLVVIESLLSVDNAAVLATMVLDLPRQERPAALRCGIIGAYLFRGLFLFFAASLIRIWWLKLFGGLYLLWLVWSWWNRQGVNDDTFAGKNKGDNPLYRFVSKRIGPFWATVVFVEIMDVAFSIDNVFAAVAFTDNLILVCIGVFTGILAMRFVAVGFVRLMEEYAFLENCAYIVLGFLGVRLCCSFFEHLWPGNAISIVLEGHLADVIMSILTVAVFLVPVITSTLFNVPAKESDG
jgi:YkoY family integral membrane protein